MSIYPWNFRLFSGYRAPETRIEQFGVRRTHGRPPEPIPRNVMERSDASRVRSSPHPTSAIAVSPTTLRTGSPDSNGHSRIAACLAPSKPVCQTEDTTSRHELQFADIDGSRDQIVRRASDRRCQAFMPGPKIRQSCQKARPSLGANALDASAESDARGFRSIWHYRPAAIPFCTSIKP